MHNPYSDPENVNKGLSQKVRESMVEEKELCKVCLDNEANMINVQCYHLSVCEGCAPSLKKQCPICRAKG